MKAGFERRNQRAHEWELERIRAERGDAQPGKPAGADQPEFGDDASIFVVHGHAPAALLAIVQLLKRTGRKVVVLHEQANQGLTILEKFERHAGEAAYAVVILTADDVAGLGGDLEDQRPRGRQNVIFELGYFFGKLGRKRVALLLDQDVERPSDIDGLVYIALDADDAWKQALSRELKAANIDVNPSP